MLWNDANVCSRSIAYCYMINTGLYCYWYTKKCEWIPQNAMLIKNSQTNGSAWVYVHMKFKNKLNVTECGCLWKQGRELIKKGLVNHGQRRIFFMCHLRKGGARTEWRSVSSHVQGPLPLRPSWWALCGGFHILSPISGLSIEPGFWCQSVSPCGHAFKLLVFIWSAWCLPPWRPSWEWHSH